MVQAALLATPENNYRYSGIGGLSALRSPQQAALIAEMNPKNAKNAGRLSVIPGTVTPRVTLNYKAKYAPTSRNSRQVTDGTAPAAASSINVDYALFREYSLKYETKDLLRLEKEAEDYLKAVQAGQLTANAGDFQMLSDAGDEIMRTIDDGMLKPVNTQCITSLAAAAGVNLLYPLAGTASQTIVLYDSDGRPKVDFMNEMNRVRLVHGVAGKLIVVCGLRGLTFLQLKEIASASDLGLDWEKMYGKLPIEWYYDEQIDTLLGEGEILVFDAGAACLETIPEHAPIDSGGIIGMNRVANTSYGTGSIQVTPAQLPTHSLDFDLRVREDDSTAYPTWNITPSVRYGIFNRPAGYHSSVGAWANTTGVFRYKLLNTAEA